MTVKLREYIVTLVLFSLSTSSKPEPELVHTIIVEREHFTQYYTGTYSIYTRLFN